MTSPRRAENTHNWSGIQQQKQRLDTALFTVRADFVKKIQILHDHSPFSRSSIALQYDPSSYKLFAEPRLSLIPRYPWRAVIFRKLIRTSTSTYLSTAESSFRRKGTTPLTINISVMREPSLAQRILKTGSFSGFHPFGKLGSGYLAAESTRGAPLCGNSEGWGPLSPDRWDFTPCFMGKTSSLSHYLLFCLLALNCLDAILGAVQLAIALSTQLSALELSGTDSWNFEC
jgi:hypothetical protein